MIYADETGYLFGTRDDWFELTLALRRVSCDVTNDRPALVTASAAPRCIDPMGDEHALCDAPDSGRR